MRPDNAEKSFLTTPRKIHHGNMGKSSYAPEESNKLMSYALGKGNAFHFKPN
jgi:hypothetical protein